MQLPNDLSNLTPEQQEQLREKLKNMSPEEINALQRQNCIFCQIVENKIPSKTIYEDELCKAILDINPAAPGHIVVLPKEHAMLMALVPKETIGHLGKVAKQLSQVQLRVLKAHGTTTLIANGGIAGQKAQHFMIHIIPRMEGDDIGLMLPNNDLTDAVAQKLIGLLTPSLKEVMERKEEREIEEKEDLQKNRENAKQPSESKDFYEDMEKEDASEQGSESSQQGFDLHAIPSHIFDEGEEDDQEEIEERQDQENESDYEERDEDETSSKEEEEDSTDTGDEEGNLEESSKSDDTSPDINSHFSNLLDELSGGSQQDDEDSEDIQNEDEEDNAEEHDAMPDVEAFDVEDPVNEDEGADIEPSTIEEETKDKESEEKYQDTQSQEEKDENHKHGKQDRKDDEPQPLDLDNISEFFTK